MLVEVIPMTIADPTPKDTYCKSINHQSINFITALHKKLKLIFLCHDGIILDWERENNE
jgi:hypothetical protein